MEAESEAMAKLTRTLWQDESGQDLAEYAMLLGLIAFVVITAIAVLGEEIVGLFNTAEETLSDKLGGDP